MADSAINGHDPVTTWDWARNFLTQAASGSESGVIGSGAKHRWMSLEELRGLIVEIDNVVNGLTTEEPGKVLDARQGKVLSDAIQAIIAKYGVANGLATLGSDGKVPASQIPSLALVDVFTVADETAMLALDAEQGDMAIRSDTSQVFILSASPATTLSNWIELAALKALVDAAIADLAGSGRTTETVKKNADDITKLNGGDTVEGSVANSIKTAIDPVKGTGWTDENLVDHEGRITQNESDIADLEGAGRTIETVKQNADDIGAIKGTGYTEGSLKTHEDRLDTLEGEGAGSVAKAIDDALEPIDARLTGLDTLVYEGKTYMVSKRIENGHLVTTYTEVV